MMANKSILATGLLAFCLLITPGGHAEEKAAIAESDDASPSEQEIAESLKKLVFVPHDSGAPAVTEAGGVRAVTVQPKIELLAPDRMARTLSATPTLYWHISKAAEGPVRFTLIADDATAIDPLLEFEIDGVDGEGIYGVSLEDRGMALEAGRRYIWSIALSAEGDSYGSNLVAQTVMKHEDAPEMARALEGASPEDRALHLAAEGYWYDAVETLSVQIERGAGNAWQAARSRLLDQAGLLQAARYDRQQASF